MGVRGEESKTSETGKTAQESGAPEGAGAGISHQRAADDIEDEEREHSAAERDGKQVAGTGAERGTGTDDEEVRHGLHHSGRSLRKSTGQCI